MAGSYSVLVRYRQRTDDRPYIGYGKIVFDIITGDKATVLAEIESIIESCDAHSFKILAMTET